MMTALFGDRRRAFYAQARPVPLPPLAPEDCADFIQARFAETGKDVGTALAPLLGPVGRPPPAHDPHGARGVGADRRPSRRTRRRSPSPATRSLTDLDDEFRAFWWGLPGGPASGARGGRPRASGRTRRRRWAGRGAEPYVPPSEPSSSAPSSRWTGRPSSGYRVVDPLLAAWAADRG